MKNKFCGTGVAMVTPFTPKGEIDFNALEKLVNHLIDGGVDYLVSLGTTGETATLSSQEKKEVFKRTQAIVQGRKPLIAGIGGNNTEEILRKINDFEIAGYDAILSVSPYYNKPTQEGIYQHYKAISANAPLPIILYNVPGRTSSCLTAETTLRLAHDCKNIIATKEASGNFDIFSEIMRDKPKDFLLISGDDGLTLPMMALGASGTISVTANAIPKLVSDMVKYALDKNIDKATENHLKLTEFTRLMFVEGNPAGVKAALHILGICGVDVRLPLVKASQKLIDLITQEIQKLKL